MKKTIRSITVIVLTLATVFGLAACTTKIGSPSITEEKAQLESLSIQAENGKWVDVTYEYGQKTFDIVKSLGELMFEAIEIGISGSFTVEAEYDYSMRLTYTAGNFLWKKESDFVYNIGERVTYTHADGKETGSYRENKLVVRKSMSKYVATLNDSQMEYLLDMFENENEKIMSDAFGKISLKAVGDGYDRQAILQDELGDVFFDECGGLPYGAEGNLVEGYKLQKDGEWYYVFMASSREWAEKAEEASRAERVGRVLYIGEGMYLDTIKEILTA